MDNNGTWKSDIGNLHGVLENYRKAENLEYSYLSGRWADAEQWRVMAKAKLFELFGYFPGEAPLATETVSVTPHPGYMRHEVLFNTAAGMRVAGSLLVPERGRGPFPAVVALHDHSGVYYYGREKIQDWPSEPEYLKEFKTKSYEGRPWASELARRGYVVLAIDSFYFGSRKLDLGSVSADIAGRIGAALPDGFEPGSAAYIEAYNAACWTFEPLVLRHILMSGATWPGMLYHDDRKCVDFLLSRPEVDPERIGCCGLSLGGVRSVHLAGLDNRIKASVAAGWMPTAESLLNNRVRNHTYMLYTPRMTAYLDFPDVASLSAPNALFVQQCAEDELYHLDGMQAACDKIGKVYSKLGVPDKYKFTFYDNGHQFNLKMQDEAFDWLDKWLK